MTRVHTISNVVTLSYEDDSQSNEINDIETARREIENERVSQELLSKIRLVKFQEIVRNLSLEYRSLKPIGPAFYGILLTIISISIYALIPVHNVIAYPYYWYEVAIQTSLSFIPTWTVYNLYRCHYCMNIPYINSSRNLLVLWVVSTIGNWIIFGGSHIIWTYFLGYHAPVPLIGYIFFLSLTAVMYLTIWYQFPDGWRKNKTFRNRMLYYILTTTFGTLVVLEYGIITKVFLETADGYQWVISLFMPIIREFNIWILLKLSFKASKGDFPATKIMEIKLNAVSHSLFLAYTVGSIATLASSVVIICADLLINIAHCMRIIYLRYKEEARETTGRQIKLLQELAIAEITELLVPLCYLLCLLMAYYGPNSDIIGNIKNSYWQYNAIEEINHSIQYLSTFFFVDFFGLLICFYLLRRTSGINLYKVCAALIDEFKMPFAIGFGMFFNGYFALNMISSANDLTLCFDWINGDFNKTVPCTTAFN